MKKAVHLFCILVLSVFSVTAQTDTLIKRLQTDTSALRINQDAIYNRPFITVGKTNTALGGYVEGNTNYFSTDGVSEGFSMELRRFNIFLYSAIAKRIKFLSELEFEHGTEEISLETAQVDFEINPALNFKTGIILAPIGAFNQNHDSPRWEFIERPLVSTKIIPSTLSEVGFGVHGKLYAHNKVFSYEAYIVNGLRDEIILNAQGRTFLPSGKSPEMFGEDNNGTPMLTGKVGFKQRNFAEFGLSYYGGIYNTFKLEGAKIDDRRRLSIYALDFNTTLFKKAVINAEVAYVTVDVPESAGQFFGNQQIGFYAEVVYPIIKKNIFGYENTIVNINFRGEYIDYNKDTFKDTGSLIYDNVTAIVPGISIRPSSNTVLRMNYRHHWERDILGNPTVRTARFQFGLATYF